MVIRSFFTNFNKECALSMAAAVAGINSKSFNILEIRGKVFSSTFREEFRKDLIVDRLTGFKSIQNFC